LAAVLVLIALRLSHTGIAADPFALVLGGLACVLIGTMLGGALTRRRLLRLEEGIVQAQDGVLRPVEPPPLDHPALVRLYEEYNRTITVLGGMFAFVEDCQHRFLTERNKINVVVQGLPLALLVVDDNLHVNTANRQAELLFSLPAGTLLGSGLFDILHVNEADRDVLRDAFLYKHHIRNRVINMTMGGGERWLTVNLSFITEQATDMAAVITLLDITDYKRLQESAYNREKLVAMGQLAAGVAHELNTPLGNMLGYAQLLLEATDDDSARQKYAGIIKDETRRCSRIIHNLLNYARKEHCYGDSCEINTLIEEVVDTFVSCRLRRHQITVERELDPANPVAEGGCGELEIVLTNLLINAIQALEGVKSPRIVIRSGTDGAGRVYVAVQDNGPGIPAEIRTRLFEPFFTTKEVGDGSGLGLAISHAMLARRGGIIKLDTEYTAGARFVIKCPAYRDAIAHANSD
jgi:two-component system, NtrC family, sensor kinase